MLELFLHVLPLLGVRQRILLVGDHRPDLGELGVERGEGLLAARMRVTLCVKIFGRPEVITLRRRDISLGSVSELSTAFAADHFRNAPARPEDRHEVCLAQIILSNQKLWGNNIE